MITVERLDAHNEADFAEAGESLLPMAREVAIVPVNTSDAAESFWLAAVEGNTFVARVGEPEERGKVAGVLSIVKGPPYWYNHSRFFFIDHVFYVAPEFRFALIGVKLLRAARDMVEPKGEAIFVRVVNQHRHQKGSPAAYYAQIAGYVPFGDLTMIRKPDGLFVPVAPEATTA